MAENKDKSSINIMDTYGDSCIRDSRTRSRLGERKPLGFVEVYENEKLVDKQNLVVYSGREWMAERVHGFNNLNTPASFNSSICSLGIGNGGAPVGDPLSPISPIATDTNLINEVPISSTDSTYYDFRNGFYYKHPFDSIEFLQDADNDNKWLVAKISTTIGYEDANGYNINEAGLFIGTDRVGGGYEAPFVLFSRVTFETLVKKNSKEFMFLWYLYF